ncbi:cob(I)yrinic acid a,c-diamide adenosyltransferase [Acidaminobacterium chupaoyuni]
MNHARGLLHLYCGDGKGKTTAAMGLILRRLGRGGKVVLVQFLKDTPSGEITALKQFENITILRGKAGAKFTFQMTEQEKQETAKIHEANLEKAIEIVKDGRCDLLVLDEAAAALQCGLLSEKPIKELIAMGEERPEIVITGRNPPQFLWEAADYITEMKLHKHPFEKGIAAREGIEF